MDVFVVYGLGVGACEGFHVGANAGFPMLSTIEKSTEDSANTVLSKAAELCCNRVENVPSPTAWVARVSKALIADRTSDVLASLPVADTRVSKVQIWRHKNLHTFP